MAVIEVKSAKKNFKRPVRKPGILGMLKTLFSMKYDTVEAVKDISFSVEKGEIVGYIGANGAGKSTTIKMMCGILTPTSGEITVDGYKPYDSKQRKHVLNNIGVVFGQRTQLWWDLPLIESLVILKEIYDVSEADYKERYQFLKEVLGLDEFINQQVRTLSLGQRMRADLAASLIHNPKILFLDEPTIGLDVLVKDKMIEAIKQIHSQYQTTIILTTHNMDDITDLCNRVIILDEGQILYDGSLKTIKNKFGDMRNISFTSKDLTKLEDLQSKLKDKADVCEDGGYIHLSFNHAKTPVNSVLKTIFEIFQIEDIKIEENSLENIVKKIYETKKA
ncbi:ATP-binding cassette domain-containing protein [Acholeplasma equirhinis]|uniref:ABC transporter ATP-binding protein n=1 Tax=Acholeplasma equirhinis TaxID=555393 RepID=UPI00197A89B1|nr:ATP-binding cassette domain-containing protein [Acholeplasma equirhinis]MBN3490427.1 ATP-binding cassette domain-containing protein [Acholeplasma equirhinis]